MEEENKQRKYVKLEPDDGTTWLVPADIIATNRANYYSEKYEDTTFEEEYKFTMSDDYELRDWIQNNMDWGKDFEPILINTPDFTRHKERDGWNSSASVVVREPPRLTPTKMGKIVHRHGLDPFFALQMYELLKSQATMEDHIHRWYLFMMEARLHLISNDDSEAVYRATDYEVMNGEHQFLDNYRDDDLPLPNISELSTIWEKERVRDFVKKISSLPKDTMMDVLGLDVYQPYKEMILNIADTIRSEE